ncbi:Alpha/Beta hydrolase protein [Xylaria sp. FL0043]|nr:Alpha/Beta hydrolase protein [Xylaria sp. FL0043]
MAYKLFSTFVDYDEPYRGMQEVYLDSKMQEASAKVRSSAEENDLFVYHPCWIDSLAHISGFVLNGTELTPADTVYISHGWKSMRIATTKLSAAKTYLAYVRMREDPKVSAVMVGDVYVIEGGHVIALIQDIKFRRIKRFQLEHFLPSKKRYSGNSDRVPGFSPRVPDTSNLSTQIEPPQVLPGIEQAILENEAKGNYVQPSAIAIAQEVGVEPEELADHALLADTGVDSLLSLSIAARVKDVLGLEVPSSLFLSSVTFGDLRDSLTEYYGLDTPSTEDETSTASTPMTSDAEEIQSDDGRQQMGTHNGVNPSELVAKANLLWQSKSPGAVTERTVLFLFPDGAGRTSSYTWLAAVDFGVTGLDAIYGLDSPFAGDDAAVFGGVSLNDVVGAYIRATRAVQPQGPYHLGGWSIGGVLAFEAASQVQHVSSLFLIDPPYPKDLEVLDSMDRAVQGFETAQEMIDIATFVHGGNQIRRSKIQREGEEDATQTHFIGSMRMLGKYHPLPLPQPGLHATLLWAKNGVLETLEQDSAATGNGGSFSGVNAASNWVLKPRLDYGPHGWDMLIQINIQCRVVEGDHFSIMKTPVVTEVGKLLGKAFDLSHGRQS